MVTDTERSMSNIVSLLHEANEPAGNLVTSFSTLTSNSKEMEIVMRLLSGTGAWKLLNKVKAVGMSIKQWNASAAEYRKKQSDMYKALTDQLKTEKELAKLKFDAEGIHIGMARGRWKIEAEGLQAVKDSGITLTKLDQKRLDRYNELSKVVNDDLFQGMKAMYGEEYASLRLLEDSNKALDYQKKKQSEINALMGEKDILSALSMQPDALGKKGHKVIGKDTMRAAKEAQARGLGKIKTDKLGVKTFKEFGKLRKTFNKPIKKMDRNISSLNKFMSGISKMVWSYLKSGLVVLGMAIKYIVLLVLGFMLAKAIYKKIEPVWKSFNKDFGTMKDKWNAFMEYWESPIKPMMMTVWENLKTFWNLLKDPKAGFMDTLKALLILLKNLFITNILITLSLLKAIILPLLGQLLATLGKLVVNFGIWAGLKIVGGWIKFTSYVKTNFPIWIENAKIAGANLIENIKQAALAKWKELKEKFHILEKISNVVSAMVTYVKIVLSLIQALYYGIKAVFSMGDTKDIAKAKAHEKIQAANTLTRELVGLQHGGIVNKAGAFIVGEKGPELLHLPKGSAVTPNMGGNTINVHVNGRVGASDQELRDIASRVGSMINREINRTTTAGVRL